LPELRFAVCCAALQAFEEVEVAREAATEEVAALGERYERLQVEAADMHGRTEGLLAENLDSLVQLGGKLTAAQVRWC
jgi:hypothetical protein